MDISNLSDIIRFPFELLGKIIYFVFDYFIEILIIGGSLYLVYYLYTSGIIKRISDYIIELKQKKEDDNNIKIDNYA